jgi:ribosomal protein L19
MGLQTNVENILNVKRTNISILDMLKIKIRLAAICKQRITSFIGLIIRSNGSSLEKMMIEGKIEGERAVGEC